MMKLGVFLDKIYLFDFFCVINKLVWLIYIVGFLLFFMFRFYNYNFYDVNV